MRRHRQIVETEVQLATLIAERDELVAALKGVIAEADRDTIPFIAARALIARIEKP